MMSRLLASVSTLALLVGFVAAPHTHLHASGRGDTNDSRHAQAVLHSHTTSHDDAHEHDAPADDGRDGQDSLFVDSFNFVFQKSTSRLVAPVAALPYVFGFPSLTSQWMGACRLRPHVYGSPPILPSAARGPPTLLPPAV